MEDAAVTLEGELRRLRWRCRRGMLELDLMLQRYLEQQGPNPDATELNAFEALLEFPDHELCQWLLGNGHPPEKRLGSVVAAIRRAAER